MRIPFPDEIKDYTEITYSWHHIRGNLFTIIKEIGPDDFIRRPEDESWSASDICEHLFLSQFTFSRIIPAILKKKLGEKTNACNFDYQETLELYIKKGGLKNPEIVKPGSNWDRDKVTIKLNLAMEKMMKNLEGKTVAELRGSGIEHPLRGLINLIEWIWIQTIHEKWHLTTLKKKFPA